MRQVQSAHDGIMDNGRILHISETEPCACSRVHLPKWLHAPHRSESGPKCNHAQPVVCPSRSLHDADSQASSPHASDCGSSIVNPQVHHTLKGSSWRCLTQIRCVNMHEPYKTRRSASIAFADYSHSISRDAEFECEPRSQEISVTERWGSGRGPVTRENRRVTDLTDRGVGPSRFDTGCRCANRSLSLCVLCPSSANCEVTSTAPPAALPIGRNHLPFFASLSCPVVPPVHEPH